MKQAQWRLRASSWETALELIKADRIVIDRHRWVELVHLGPVFSFSGASPAQALKVAISASATNIDLAEHITKTVWGSYLAIIVDEEKACRIFVPDPMQSIQLYYRQPFGGRVDLDVDLTRMVAGHQPVWNIGFLVHFVETRYSVDGHTPFLDVGSVPPGYCLQVNADGTVEMMQAWFGPASQDIAPSDLADNMVAAFRTLFNNQNNIVLPLAHETASSAAAIFLRTAVPSLDRVRFIQLPSPEPTATSKENSPQHIAEAIGASATSLNIDEVLPLAKLVPKQLPTVLSERLLFLGREEAIMDIAGESGLLLEWQGGDILFNATPSARAVTDAFRARGGSFALATAKKLAHLRQAKVSHILVEGILQSARALLLGTEHAETVGYRGLFPDRSDIIPKSRVRQPKRFKRTLSSRAALKGQWTNLARAQMLQAPVFGNSIAWLNPYFAQPVVEAAMQIRSYDSFTHDFDQLDLRNAANRLATCEALWHKTAASPETNLFRGLQMNRRYVEELIQQGVLMKSGYLDRRVLLKALTLIEKGNLFAARSISLIVCVEIFCAAWQNAVEPPEPDRHEAHKYSALADTPSR